MPNSIQSVFRETEGNSTIKQGDLGQSACLGHIIYMIELLRISDELKHLQRKYFNVCSV